MSHHVTLQHLPGCDQARILPTCMGLKNPFNQNKRSEQDDESSSNLYQNRGQWWGWVLSEAIRFSVFPYKIVSWIKRSQKPSSSVLLWVTKSLELRSGGKSLGREATWPSQGHFPCPWVSALSSQPGQTTEVDREPGLLLPPRESVQPLLCDGRPADPAALWPDAGVSGSCTGRI